MGGRNEEQSQYCTLCDRSRSVDRRNGGWGHSVRLTLDADGTYEAQWKRGCWDGEREKGTFTMSEGLVWIELPDGKPHTMTEGTRYVPVKWGERRFLIPPDQLVEFRSDVLEGFDSDNISGYGMESCFRRTVDEDKPVSGVPVAPGRWQDYFYGIIAKSIEATVTSVYTETGRYGKLHYVTIDQGTADGLRRGMRTCNYRRMMRAMRKAIDPCL